MLSRSLTFTANGDVTVSIPLGKAFTVAASGTWGSGTLSAQYAKTPGVFAGFSTTALALSANGEFSGRNMGAHTDINLHLTGATAPNLLVIVNQSAD